MTYTAFVDYVEGAIEKAGQSSQSSESLHVPLEMLPLAIDGLMYASNFGHEAKTGLEGHFSHRIIDESLADMELLQNTRTINSRIRAFRAFQAKAA